MGMMMRRLSLYRPQFPLHMVWLSTNACNARCVHCSSDSLKCFPDELSTSEAKQLFEDLASIGVVDLAVSGGEPFTRPDLFELLEHAVGLGLRVGVGSNGSTIDDSVVERLAEIGIDRLQISIDGTAATHDLARRWNGLYRRSAAAIERGIEAGLRVHVCFTVHALNYSEIDAVASACCQWGVSRLNVSRFVPTGRGDASLDLPPWQWRAVIEHVEELRQNPALKISTHLAQLVLVDEALACEPAFAGCQAGLAQGCIDARGNVMPCVMLPVVVGNIRERSLREIWREAPLLQSLRDRSNLQGNCGACELKDQCGGCRGVALAYTGDPLGADPRCWKT
jgi:radical SAM protein with 4Fe4S-binding SPASM domain